MPQTSVIAAGLVIGFIVFITTRGELPAYLGIFLGTGTTRTSLQAGPSGFGAPMTQVSGSTVNIAFP